MRSRTDLETIQRLSCELHNAVSQGMSTQREREREEVAEEKTGYRQRRRRSEQRGRRSMAEEEEDTRSGRRWRVTYTKHLKQKRKVYHDGFLVLTASGDKVRLYDEGENLIESKFLKKTDSIERGKSLAMDCHLVDIADPVHLISVNPAVTPVVQHNGSKRNSFSRKPLHRVSNAMQTNDKVEAKKAEPCTTGGTSTNVTSPQTNLEEWNVLYTTQLTKNAKKYHDGKLRLSQLGSHAKQVRLYDEFERLLESKVLGKEDMLESGRTLIMQAHLVDICASKIQPTKEISLVSSLRKPFQKPASTIDSFSDGNGRTEAASVKPIIPETSSILKEWNVLYTNQLNKKATTYHDGSLRLVQAKGSFTKQITLASEDGQLLGSRHLKSFECIESGSECELSGYLIQVDDLRVCQEGYAGSIQKSPLKQFVKSKTLMENVSTVVFDVAKEEQVKNMKPQTDNRMEIDKTTHGYNKKNPLEQSMKSNTLVHSIPTRVVDGTKEEQVTNMKPQIGNRIEMENTSKSKTSISATRRDACQIMSVLRKPTIVQESEETQVAKESHPSLHHTQTDNSTRGDKLPATQGMHEKYRNAYHCSSISSIPMNSGIKASETQIVVKDNCITSSMQNSSSVLSGATVSSGSHDDRCETVNLQESEKGDKQTGSVEASFADFDNFDFPTFDLGF